MVWWQELFRTNKLFMDDIPFKRTFTCRLPPPLSLDFAKIFSAVSTSLPVYLSKLRLLTKKVKLILFLLSSLSLSLFFYLKTFFPLIYFL